MIVMSKTITIRLDDNIYQFLNQAAKAERRSIANFIEFAALSYLQTESFITDEEMNSILKNQDLLNSLQNGINDIKEGKYKTVD
jgi:predicted transcriptional regulator